MISISISAVSRKRIKPSSNYYGRRSNWVETKIESPIGSEAISPTSPFYTGTIEAQKKIILEAEQQLGITKLDDWYKIKPPQIKPRLRTLIARYGSLYNTLVNLYPDHSWHSWRFGKLPPGFWQYKQNRLDFLEDAAKKLNIEQMSDWYKLKVTEFQNKVIGGSAFLQLYKGSLSRALSDLYPNYDWKPWLFSHVPSGTWKEQSIIRQFLESISSSLGVKKMDDWYQVRREDLIKYGGSSLTVSFESMAKILSYAYPEHEWKEWRFKGAQAWSSKENHKEFIEWLSKELGIQRTEDWYKFNSSDIKRNGGSRILNYYEGSYIKMLQSLYPDVDWAPYRFVSTSKTLWNDVNQQKGYLLYYASQKGLKSLDDWYKVKISDFVSFEHGQGFLHHFDGSLTKALITLFPEHNWEIWRFRVIPDDLLKSEKVMKSVVSHIENSLKIQTVDDWYRISDSLLFQLGVRPFVRACGGLYGLLKTTRPDIVWDENKFNQSYKKAGQRLLSVRVEEMFPGQEIIVDYLHPLIRFQSLQKAELDIFVPGYNIAFEYHGEQHYHDIVYFGSVRTVKERDLIKKMLAEAAGVTLVEIPYWWDGSLDSLRSTVSRIRPDLISHPTNSNPIPPFPSKNPSPFKGEVDVANSFIMAKRWDFNQDPSGWWLSEKYDGTRALWDGNALYSRQGRKFEVPDFFVRGMPPIALDGELWINRESFQQVVSITKTSDPTKWENVKFYVFDAPKLEGTFEQRMELLTSMKLPNHVHIIKQTKCEGKDHFQETLMKITKEGGEGLMLRKAGSNYISGRSHDILYKAKYYQDSEVRYIEMKSGGLVCEQLNGLRCTVQPRGSLSALPQPGAILTVSHSGYWESGILKYPAFLRERRDVTWEQLLKDQHNKE